jgi:hypothetical protein
MASSKETLDAYTPQVEAFLKGVALKGAAAAPSGGAPRGMFFARSNLTGKAVCLLFLDGGRITREIPEGGLEDMRWEKHLAANPKNSGTYSFADGKLTVRWGDGGVHEGPVKATARGLEFYGKGYVKPAPVTVAELAGEWESALTAPGGGGMTHLQELTISADGTFRWKRATGGSGDGWAAFGGATEVRGRLTVQGTVATFRSDDGAVATHTILRMPGEPIIFALGRYIFSAR